MSTRHPNPQHFPSYRNPSAKQKPTFGTDPQRTQAARAFHRGAHTYQDVRPHYPPEVAELIAGAHRVADIGAGTGKLTESLTNPTVLAVEPSADMARVLQHRLDIPIIRATAEHTALADASSTPPASPKPGTGSTLPPLPPSWTASSRRAGACF